MLLHGSKVVWGDGELYALPPHVYAGFGYCPRDVLPLPRSEETIIFHIGLWTNDAVDPTSSFDPGGYSNTLWYTKVSDILPSKTHLGGRAVRIFGYFSDPLHPLV